MTSMCHCPSCEAELPVYAHLCRHCGRKLRDVTAQDDVTQELVSPARKFLVLIIAHAQALYQSMYARLPEQVQLLLLTIIERSKDTEAEKPLTNKQHSQGIPMILLGWFPLLALIDAVGVFLVAYADTTARYGAIHVDVFFWLGILLIFLPTTTRLISRTASRVERLCLLCSATICFYLVNELSSPLSFSGHDEFLHWRTASDLTRSGHLFSVNTLLPASPFYPGLEIMTNALTTLTGLDTFQAGLLIICIAHLLMILSLFLLYEHITQSARIAGIATIIYMTNPHFVFFDSSFSYESLALPLAIFVLFTLANYMKPNNEHRWMILAAWIPLGAIAVTHHMTDFVLDGLLLLWAIIDGFKQRTRLHRSSLIRISLFGIILSIVWVNMQGNPVIAYLSSYFGTALQELQHILKGTSNARRLFTTYSGPTAPLWERMLAISSVVFITLSLPFSLLCLWQRYRHNALVIMLGIVALAYPVTQIFRFTNFGTEITDRAAAFLFIALSCALAIFITQFCPVRKLTWINTSVISLILTVLFLGGVVLDAGPPWELLPGPYLVAADARSIEPEGVQSATWAYSHLGPNNTVATDRTNRLLMTTYGDQRIVTFLASNLDVTPAFFSPNFNAEDASLLQQAKVRYLVVDTRLSTSLPSLGFYFEPGEPYSFQRTAPIARNALTKFSDVPQINRVFDSGNIVIYDVEGLTHAQTKP